MYNSRIETAFIKARAKINLNLQVLEKREDNYHNLESVFQKINIWRVICKQMWTRRINNKFKYKRIK